MSDRDDRFLCPKCKGAKTLLATPLSGKFAGHCVQVPIRKNIVLAGFGHKLRKRCQDGWTQGLLDGEIYVFLRDPKYRCFAKLNASCLKDVHRLLGPTFVAVDKGILVAKLEVVEPMISDKMVSVRIGVDEHGDDVVTWIKLTRDGAKRLKESLPTYKRPPNTPVPDEAALRPV